MTERTALGGKAIYGARLGILMLEARFPRIPGDMGNATTWPFPVFYKVVRGASPDRVVRRGGEGTLDSFVAAAKELVADGVDGITTNCGFLSLFQADIQAAVPVPVATSSLMQVPMVARLLPPGRRVGILTVSAETLTHAHLEAAGVPTDTPIVGTDGGREFSRVIVGNEERLDVAAAEADMLDAADALIEKAPDVGAIVFECTNMAPYAKAVREHVARPVFDIFSLIAWFHAGLAPMDFGPPATGPGVWREPRQA